MEFDRAFKRFILKEPFYGLFFLNLIKEETDKIATAGVCYNNNFFKFVWNNKFWSELTDVEQMAVLKHECLHIIYEHCTLYNDLENHEIANIAMDAEINRFISGLPKGCVTQEKIKEEFPDFEENQGTRYNYKFLLSHAQSLSGTSGNSDQGQGQDQQSGSSMQDKLGKVIDDHSYWGELQGMSPEAKEALNAQIKGVLKTTYENIKDRNPGNIPGELVEMLKELLTIKPQVFNWKKYFRRALGSGEVANRVQTRKRPSKRFVDSPGCRHVHKLRILVAVDTSGSVSNQDILDAFSEITHVYRAGAEVWVTQFDCNLTKPTKFKGHFDGQVYGRGGTAFDPVVKYYNDNRQYDQLVIITDGYASLSISPRLNKCIWIVTSDLNNFPGIVINTKNN